MHVKMNETSMTEVKMELAQDIVGGWDPFASAIQGATTGWNIGNQLLGPLGGILGGLAGFLSGFFGGLFGA